MDYLLNEDGTYLLNEDGTYIALEEARIRYNAPEIIIIRGRK